MNRSDWVAILQMAAIVAAVTFLAWWAILS
jgi:hypothetical protein